KGWTADELAQLPTYYVMDLDQTMAETVAAKMPTPEEVAACAWLTEAELRVYSGEYGRTGFHGGLQWYRCRTTGLFEAAHQLVACRTLYVPERFIAGACQWGIHQIPGAREKMFNRACTAVDQVDLIEGAGHRVQQERPEEVNRSLLDFLSRPK